MPRNLVVKSATLGDIIYANQSATVVVEEDWVVLVRAIAAGDQAALHALFERSQRLVYTLAMRITRNRETAEELTVDVFHDVWRRAPDYDVANGSVLGWIMNQARSRAIDRVRFDNRKRRTPVAEHEPAPIEHHDADDALALLELRQRGDAVRDALVVLTPDERQVIEAAFFAEQTHAEVAARLELPLGTVKTRIRSALHKLRHALAADGKSS